VLLIEAIHDLFPWLRHLFADGAYAGGKLQQALAPLGRWTIEIVKRSDLAKGFVLLPRRWVVEPHLRLAQPQPPPRQGLRGHPRQRQSLAIPRLGSTPVKESSASRIQPFRFVVRH
jgi:hypothetical protein